MQANYKAWHVDEQVMYHDPIINGMNGLVVRVYNNVIVGHYATDEVIPLQYTGLQDINGIDICLGDVVLASRGDWGWTDEISVVVYKDGGFYINSFCFYEKIEPTWDVFFSAKDLDLKVIGNKYENPELLEVEFDG
ncbi:YopX family protein [Paenibacillus sp. FSL R10-2796]|uniref:YopX family protein n=1 Tax=Paenibacillus sp. FSL R10-2796 TaxID=2954663 RepID=UPI0030D8D10B